MRKPHYKHGLRLLDLEKRKIHAAPQQVFPILESVRGAFEWAVAQAAGRGVSDEVAATCARQGYPATEANAFHVLVQDPTLLPTVIDVNELIQLVRLTCEGLTTLYQIESTGVQDLKLPIE